MTIERRGLVIVHTGNGKGKTTAALGLGLRAFGQGMTVLALQFIKGGWKYGELAAIEKLGPGYQIRPLGEGFAKASQGDEKAAHQAAAAAALAVARAELTSQKWDMVILDEINYAVNFGLIAPADVLELLDLRPARVHLVLTGRGVRDEIAARADLITEMKEVKHPYKQGVKAQQGIEF